MSLPPNEFPNLLAEGFKATSPATRFYNCIAHAAEDPSNFWWPDPDAYWPSDIPMKTTIYTFLKLFRSLGYSSCNSGSLEVGYQKVAIYALDNKVTHAARQLPSGAWTSKMGRNIDIEHNTVMAVEGPKYGSVARYLRRQN